MRGIPLIHPIYLDVPMLVSFAAAIRGGVAMQTEVTQHESEKQSKGSTVGGRLAASNFLKSLFDISAEGSHESKKEGDVTASRKESKAHTEASIAIMLYHDLRQLGGYISTPANVEDVAEIDVGTLVEIGGTVEKNAIDQMIDYLDAIVLLSGLAPDNVHEESRLERRKGRAATQPRLKDQLRGMRDALDSDRKRTPISNIVVRCSTPDGLTVVATLRTANLRDLTLSELDKNSVRVIGKITRALPVGKSMSSFENYGMSMLSPVMLKESFDGIRDLEGSRIPISDTEVYGPAWQILPLMVFV